MGLSPNLKAPLLGIGGLRNRFAHRPNYNLKAGDVNDLYATLSKTHQQHLKKAYKTLAERVGREEQSFSELSEIERLNLLFMLIRAQLKIALSQLETTGQS